MTGAAYLVLLCDHRDPGGGECSAETHWPVAFEPHTHRELRRLRRPDGWRFTRDGRDLCPDHGNA